MGICHHGWPLSNGNSKFEGEEFFSADLAACVRLEGGVNNASASRGALRQGGEIQLNGFLAKWKKLLNAPSALRAGVGEGAGFLISEEHQGNYAEAVINLGAGWLSGSVRKGYSTNQGFYVEGLFGLQFAFDS